MSAFLMKKIWEIENLASNRCLGDVLFCNESFYVEKASSISVGLNNIKNELDSKELRLWNNHTRMTLLTGQVVAMLRNRYEIEMATVAWTKMYEILCSFHLVGVTDIENHFFYSLHICEAPGAFICALNHYIQSKFKNTRWDWLACTFNPYHRDNLAESMIDDDAFISATKNKWYFGADNTGDMRLPCNIQGTWNRAKKMGNIMLVTADGGVDCSLNPKDQESIVAQLLYCETVTALGVLHIGGEFVLKMFTFFEDSSICLLALLKLHFETVHVCKPETSKPGNSETYVVCKGFRGIARDVLQVLLLHTGKDSPQFADGRGMFSRAFLGERWIQSVVECAAYFAKLQSEAIQRNLALFEDCSEVQKNEIYQSKKEVAEKWTARYQITQISPEQRIVQSRMLRGDFIRTALVHRQRRRRDSGTLQERRNAYCKRFKPGVERDTGHTTSNTVERMMQKMGYKKGQGLGRENQGIKTHIQTTARIGRWGLDYVN